MSPLPELPQLSPFMKMGYLFLQSLVPTIPASFLTLGDNPLYTIYETLPRIWGLSAHSDQVIAGLIMKLGGGMLLWGFIAWVFFVHNCFASLQDVATDALAVDLLEDDERGRVNGMMWASKLLGIVLTMVDYRAKATRQNVARMREEFGSGVFAVEIRTNIRLAEAPAAGQTIFEFDDSSTGADAYRRLAEEYLLRCQESEIVADDGMKLAPKASQGKMGGASTRRERRRAEDRAERRGTPSRSSRI